MAKCDRCNNILKRKDIIYHVDKEKILIAKGKNRPYITKAINYKNFCKFCYKFLTNNDEDAEIKDIVYTEKDLKTNWIVLFILMASVVPLAYIFNHILFLVTPLFLSGLVLIDIRTIKKYLREHAN